MVHSKNKRGHGFLHTNASQQRVVFKEIELAQKEWSDNNQSKL